MHNTPNAIDEALINNILEKKNKIEKNIINTAEKPKKQDPFNLLQLQGLFRPNAELSELKIKIDNEEIYYSERKRNNTTPNPTPRKIKIA